MYKFYLRILNIVHEMAICRNAHNALDCDLNIARQ